ncbi:DMT family transporter [Gordonia terrae]|uniref:EamA family transporter n=1 Tax=Gordonia hongkongensis TaxID=1701090 RepID=UPI0022B36B87|nr:DMT family transporter [Gordonia terrae]
MNGLTLSAPILLGIGAAFAYGASDFVGGIASRRASAWAVAGASQATAAIIAVPFAVMTFVLPTASSAGWAALAGLGAGIGNVMIYHGLATGRMLVVAPVASIASTSFPVTLDVVTGYQPSAFISASMCVALLACWFAAGGRVRAIGRAGKTDLATGVLAGMGFGTQFVALGQIGESAGLTPVALSQIVSVAFIVAVPLTRRVRLSPMTNRSAGLAVAAGALAGAATVLFQVTAQSGPLTTAVVLTSLYPAVTVSLAAILLRERATRIQVLGLVLAAVSVILIRFG